MKEVKRGGGGGKEGEYSRTFSFFGVTWQPSMFIQRSSMQITAFCKTTKYGDFFSINCGIKYKARFGWKVKGGGVGG